MKLPTSRIYLNTIPSRYKKRALWKVRPDSTIRLRKEVKRFSEYFWREQCAGLQFDLDDTTDYTAYLLVSELATEPVWSGACCFRPLSYVDVGSCVQTLGWVWVHPFYRNEGLLASNWDELRKVHGDFFVAPPHSAAMRNFLIKHNANSKFAGLYREKSGKDSTIKQRSETASE